MSHWIPRAELNAYQPQLDTFAVWHLEADLQFPTLNAEDHYFPSLEKQPSRREGPGEICAVAHVSYLRKKIPLNPPFTKGGNLCSQHPWDTSET